MIRHLLPTARCYLLPGSQYAVPVAQLSCRRSTQRYVKLPPSSWGGGGGEY